MRTPFGLCIIGCLALLAACVQSPPGSEKTTNINPADAQETPTRPPVEQVRPIIPTQEEATLIFPNLPTPYAPEIQGLIDLAKTDLADRLSIELSQISTSVVNQVTWPDTSLGCQSAGIYSAQVLTPGYRILLEYAQKTYEFHTDSRKTVVYCKIPLPPVDGTPSQ